MFCQLPDSLVKPSYRSALKVIKEQLWDSNLFSTVCISVTFAEKFRDGKRHGGRLWPLGGGAGEAGWGSTVLCGKGGQVLLIHFFEFQLAGLVVFFSCLGLPVLD